MHFSDPVFVSHDASNVKLSDKDRIKVSVLDSSVFVDPNFNAEVEIGTIEIEPIEVPKQYGASTTKAMKAVDATTKVVINVVMPLSLLLFVSSSQDEFWRALNLMQFIPFTKDWQYSLPSNVFTNFEQVGYITHLGWLQKARVLQLLNFKGEEN